MTARTEVPLSGVFRVVYFLATGIVTLFVVLTAIVAFYEPPDDDSSRGVVPGNTRVTVQTQTDDSRHNYNRNVSLIFTLVSAGIFATGILGLGSRFNPLRAALLLGGLLLFLTGMGFWVQSSDHWIGFVMSGAVFGVLAAGYLWLEDGLPLGPRGPVTRLSIPPARPEDEVPPPPPPAHPPPPPSPFSAPPRTMPQEEGSVPPPEARPTQQEDGQPPGPV